MNAYEQAIERKDFARVAHAAALAALELAEQELEAAWDNLSDHEEHPGIPLPQYRTHTRVLPPIATTVTPWCATETYEDHFIGLGHYDDPERDAELAHEAEQERRQQLHDEMIACDDGHRAW